MIAQSTPVPIRWLIRPDMPEVLQIEQASFSSPWQWSEEDFRLCLKQRDCIGMVAEHHGQIIGFMIYRLRKTQFDLLNIAVHPDFRRQAVGTRMINRLIDKLNWARRRAIRVEIRERNLTAQLFFQANRFMATQVLRNEYLDTGEDCYVMRYELHPENEV